MFLAALMWLSRRVTRAPQRACRAGDPATGRFTPALMTYRNFCARFKGLMSKALAVMLKLLMKSTLKRAKVRRVRLTPQR